MSLGLLYVFPHSILQHHLTNQRWCMRYHSNPHRETNIFGNRLLLCVLTSIRPHIPLTSPDETVSLILWNSTELTVSILCATIPTLRPLYKEFLSLFSRRRRSPSLQSYKLDNTPSAKSEPFKSSSVSDSGNTYASKSSVSVGAQQMDINAAIFKESGGSQTNLRSRDGRGTGNGMGSQDGIFCTDVVYVEFEDREEPPPGTACSKDWSRRGCQNWEVV